MQIARFLACTTLPFVLSAAQEQDVNLKADPSLPTAEPTSLIYFMESAEENGVVQGIVVDCKKFVSYMQKRFWLFAKTAEVTIPPLPEDFWQTVFYTRSSIFDFFDKPIGEATKISSPLNQQFWISFVDKKAEAFRHQTRGYAASLENSIKETVQSLHLQEKSNKLTAYLQENVKELQGKMGILQENICQKEQQVIEKVQQNTQNLTEGVSQKVGKTNDAVQNNIKNLVAVAEMTIDSKRIEHQKTHLFKHLRKRARFFIESAKIHFSPKEFSFWQMAFYKIPEREHQTKKEKPLSLFSYIHQGNWIYTIYWFGHFAREATQEYISAKAQDVKELLAAKTEIVMQEPLTIEQFNPLQEDQVNRFNDENLFALREKKEEPIAVVSKLDSLAFTAKEIAEDQFSKIRNTKEAIQEKAIDIQKQGQEKTKTLIAYAKKTGRDLTQPVLEKIQEKANVIFDKVQKIQQNNLAKRLEATNQETPFALEKKDLSALELEKKALEILEKWGEDGKIVVPKETSFATSFVLEKEALKTKISALKASIQEKVYSIGFYLNRRAFLFIHTAKIDLSDFQPKTPFWEIFYHKKAIEEQSIERHESPSKENVWFFQEYWVQSLQQALERVHQRVESFLSSFKKSAKFFIHSAKVTWVKPQVAWKQERTTSASSIVRSQALSDLGSSVYPKKIFGFVAPKENVSHFKEVLSILDHKVQQFFEESAKIAMQEVDKEKVIRDALAQLGITKHFYLVKDQKAPDTLLLVLPIDEKSGLLNKELEPFIKKNKIFSIDRLEEKIQEKHEEK